MFKRISIFLILVLLTAVTASAQQYHYNAAVFRATATERGGTDLTEVITGITYQVLDVGENDIATLTKFGDTSLTSKTNPITTTVFAVDDRIQFQSTAATVDIIVTDTAGGYSTTISGFSPNDHSVVIDEVEGVSHAGVVPFVCDGTSVTDTGIDFPYDSRISNVTVEAISGAAGGDTINVGLLASETDGDEDGFVVNWSTDRTGMLAMTLASSGDLMDDASNFNPGGHYVQDEDAVSLTYTCPVEAGAAIGYIHYNVQKVR